FYNRRADRGASIFDIRQNFSANATYDLPFGKGRRFGGNLAGAADQILGGWQISSIVGVSTGMPVTLLTSFNRSQNGDSRIPDRPNLKAGASNNPVLGGPDKYYDPTVFELPAAGFLGNLGRSTMRAPGVRNFDLTIVKRFQV